MQVSKKRIGNSALLRIQNLLFFTSLVTASATSFLLTGCQPAHKATVPSNSTEQQPSPGAKGGNGQAISTEAASSPQARKPAQGDDIQATEVNLAIQDNQSAGKQIAGQASPDTSALNRHQSAFFLDTSEPEWRSQAGSTRSTLKTEQDISTQLGAGAPRGPQRTPRAAVGASEKSEGGSGMQVYTSAYMTVPKNDHERKAQQLIVKARAVLQKNPKAQDGMQMIEEAHKLAPDYAPTLNACGVTLQTRDEQEAIKLFEKAVSMDPHYKRAWINLAVSCTSVGRYGQALNAWRQALHLDPGDKDCWLNLGKLNIDLNRGNEAEQCFKQAVELAPRDATAWAWLGYTGHGMKRWIPAVQCYKKALALDPKNEFAQLYLAHLYRNTGHFDLADKAYEDLVKLHPQSTEAWLQVGNYRAFRNKIDGAKEAFRTVSKLNPKSTDGIVSEADLCANTGDLKSARALYDRAVKTTPGWYRGWFGLGLLATHDHNWKEAEKTLSTAANLAPRNASVWNSFACVFAYQGKYAEAARLFRKVVALDPNSSLGWSNLSEIQRELGNMKEAKECAQKAVQLAPGNYQGLCCLGTVRAADGQFDEAISLFERSLSISPNYADAWGNLGVVYYKKKELKKALECLTKATDLRPDNSLAWKNLAAVYKDMGKKSEEANALKMALKTQETRSPTDLYDMAYSLEALGQKTDASKALKKGLEMEPDEADVLLNVPYVIEQNGKKMSPSKVDAKVGARRARTNRAKSTSAKPPPGAKKVPLDTVELEPD